MPSDEKKQFEVLLKPCLKHAGFSKKAATWYRCTENTIQVVNLQGSQWSKIFFINLGVYLRSLGSSKQPAEYDCHIRTRLSQIVRNRYRLSELLDAHSVDFRAIDRSDLPTILVMHALPWLEKCSTKEGCAEEIAARRCMVRKNVQDAWVQI
ncbi:MAG: hypothetical protein DRJ65_11625 [Acidobacteria bacterium]|nr:MAG: hypothetical protein DRJ65_11625 [Acidobacteriota bacterium]